MSKTTIAQQGATAMSELANLLLPTAGDAPAVQPDGIDLSGIVRLAGYLREDLWIVHFADGRAQTVERDRWYEILRRLDGDDDRRLSPVTAGRYDCIWTVKPCPEDAP